MSEPQVRRLANGSTFFDMNGSWTSSAATSCGTPASILRDPAFRRVRDDTLIMLIYPSVHRSIYPSVRASEFDCVVFRD